MRTTFLEKYAERIIFLLAVLLAFFVSLMVYGSAEAAAREKLQTHMSEEVLRFHVLANSDSSADQSQKLKVRDAVLAYLESRMPETDGVSDAKMWIREHIDEIEQVSREAAGEYGTAYPVSAAVTTCWFPDRIYGDIWFPAGNYEALRIEIGSAGGHNWWCVLYPGLCFTDTGNAVVPDEGRQKLKNVLTEEEYSRVTAGTEFRIRWFFWRER